MSSFVKLENVNVKPQEVEYLFSFSDDLAKYFKKNVFWVKYDLSDLSSNFLGDLRDVPLSVLNLVFLGNVLPIIWLTDSDLYVSQVDREFAVQIPKIKRAFQEMYPKLNFAGREHFESLVDTDPFNKGSGAPILFFSAGVDAWQTLSEHVDESPILFTMFGADFYLDNAEGNDYCSRHIQKVATDLDCGYSSFTSELRQFINEPELNKSFQKALGFHWWHRIQHGLGVILHSAPVAYLQSSKRVYFASSYSFKDRERHACATDPEIDNLIHFAGTKVFHDGYEYSRQDKIFNIVRFSHLRNKPLFIHVCWKQDKKIQNCCKCEKCLRTIFGIIAEGYDPKDFGFDCSIDDVSKRVKYLLETSTLVLTKEMWEQILYRFKMNPGLVKIFPQIKWVYSFTFPDERKVQLVETTQYSIWKRLYRRLFGV